MVDHQRILERIDALREGGGTTDASDLAGARQSTITILELVYGAGSEQVQRFIGDWQPQNPREVPGTGTHRQRVAGVVNSVLAAARQDLEAGITKSREALAKGEVLGDFVALAREALDHRSPEADGVAAVLAAASLEDVLTQLGETHGVSVAGKALPGKIEKLKGADLLQGGQATVASGFVAFRNNALHGKLSQIDRAESQAVLAFVQELLLKRFS